MCPLMWCSRNGQNRCTNNFTKTNTEPCEGVEVMLLFVRFCIFPARKKEPLVLLGVCTASSALAAYITMVTCSKELSKETGVNEKEIRKMYSTVNKDRPKTTKTAAAVAPADLIVRLPVKALSISKSSFW